MKESPAFYARPGSRIGDLITLLHPPYTMWHLGYVAIGAALAPAVDWARLGGTLVTFFLALGVAAHALDEYHDRPLGTSFMDRTLIGMAATALGLGAVLVAAGVAVVDSPLILLWAGVGLVLVVGYPLERPPYLHTDLGFALAWGGYPVLASYWVQTGRFSWSATVMAAAAVLLAAAQRDLSTPARRVRRRADSVDVLVDGVWWEQERLLATWERPLRWMSWTVPAIAVALLLAHV